MNIEIDNKTQREILSLQRKILSNSPFAYMQHIPDDCVSIVKKIGKMITDKGVTIDEKCIHCPIKDCDCINCKFQNDKEIIYNEPTSLYTENVIQTLHVRGKDKEDALQRVKAKFGDRYEPFKIELV